MSALRRAPWAVLGAIAAGGALGALGRYGLAVAWPHRPGRFPWATFVTNVSGCLLIGVLMVLVVEVWSAHRLLRPFLGVGVLGGYTTFSTFALDSDRLIGVVHQFQQLHFSARIFVRDGDRCQAIPEADERIAFS